MTALILAPLAIIAIFYLPITGLAIVLSAILCISCYEWSGFISPLSAPRALITASLAIVWFLSFHAIQWPLLLDSSRLVILLGAACLFWLIALFFVASYPKTISLWSPYRWIKWLFAIFALIPFGWSFLALRNINPLNTNEGAWWVMYVMLLVWAADSGAYFAGRQWGKTKLAAQVSPKKTVEGLMGGVIAAMVVCGLMLALAHPQGNYSVIAVSSLLASVVSVLGDLFESMLKREAGIKDSSQLLPGHGGILDRIDSLTAALPVFTFCYVLWSAV